MAAVLRHVTLGETLLATVGLAMRRHYLSAPDSRIHRLTGDLARILAQMDKNRRAGQAEALEVRIGEGYSGWAPTYDEVDAEGNDGFEHETPTVHALLRALPRGHVLDAACGTGRHLVVLRDLGHELSGFDASAEMLAVARAKVPEANLRVASLERLPWGDGTFDAVLCALAMEHQPTVAPAIAELARVVRPGGRVIVSDQHPVQKLLGHQASYTAPDKTVTLLPSYAHLHSEYLRAFAASGLHVRSCHEPVVEPGDQLLSRHPQFREAAEMAFLGLPTALVWELDRT
ncbi:MAG TPA: class I SAM-dependent methyltransferase [Rhizomicrobium sp.]|jgi:ubiquinone/menaquinone biosynthesis C-methylase UbiE